MSIELTTYLTGRDVTPTEDALVYEFATSGDGILYGCDVSVEDDNTIFVASGHGIFRGRKFTVQEEVIPVALPTSGNKSMRLIIHMDLSNANKPIEFINQEVAIPLIQDEDINIINGVYELELATYILTSTSITDFRKTFTKLERGATTVTIDDVVGLRDTAQLSKLTQDDGFALRGENDCNKITKSGDYYLLGGSIKNGPEGVNVAALLKVVAEDDRNLAQFFTSNYIPNMYCGYRICDNGRWSSWQKLGGIDARIYDIVFLNGYKPSPYSAKTDNKVIVIGDTATMRIRTDSSGARGGRSFAKIPKNLVPKTRTKTTVLERGHCNQSGTAIESISRNKYTKKDLGISFQPDGTLNVIHKPLQVKEELDGVTFACWNIGEVV